MRRGCKRGCGRARCSRASSGLSPGRTAPIPELGPPMSTPLRLGIAGLGTVGTGVLRIIRQQTGLIESRAGRPVTTSAVAARNRDKDRGVDISAHGWEDDPVALATRDDVDVFVELMGGSDGPAKAATQAAIAAGKDVVTANKAMLALH